MMPRMKLVASASWTFPSGSLQPKYLEPQPRQGDEHARLQATDHVILLPAGGT